MDGERMDGWSYSLGHLPVRGHLGRIEREWSHILHCNKLMPETLLLLAPDT
jgi:hypothetical protein